MPRKLRFFLPHVPNHVVQRGRSRDPIFFESSDYYFYLDKLREALLKYEVSLHSYVLMTNHVHLLMSAQDEKGISLVMQYVGRYYVPYINHKYGFSGSLWEGRFKSNLIESERYLFACMRYIELNPVRANLVVNLEDYPYSSYHANALGEPSMLVQPHDVFKKLSDDELKRHDFYRQLFNEAIAQEDLEQIRAGYSSGTPIGSEGFKQKVEAVCKRKVGELSRGRPKVR